MPGKYTGGGRYTVPFDSTQGIPDEVFIGFWVIILAFVVLIAWEFRHEIFKRK